MARKTVAQIRQEEFTRGISEGLRRAVQDDLRRAKAVSADTVMARSSVIKAAAELATANAKLTYALSRIINEKGW